MRPTEHEHELREDIASMKRIIVDLEENCNESTRHVIEQLRRELVKELLFVIRHFCR
jgi:hypothetical protein